MTTTSPTPLLHAPRPRHPVPNRSAHGWRLWRLSSGLAMALTGALCTPVLASDPAPPAARAPAPPATKPATPASASASKTVAEQLHDAVATGALPQKRLTLVINGKEKKYITLPARDEATPAQAAVKAPDSGRGPAPVAAAAAAAPTITPAATPPRRHATAARKPIDSRAQIRARAAALAGHETRASAGTTGMDGHGEGGHWNYQGETGPQAWGQLKPEFNVCANGKRQSPINIDESATLQGPAEPLQFDYQPSSGTVVNNGHTIQVDVEGNNTVTVRGSSFKLLQFHFHHPAEERVNGQGFAMVAHLVHKNAEGQLAVVAVLLDPGAANALINKVWTHMPLDTHDRVRLPAGLIDMSELLPKDQRYYQFMGSLTTPPCSEGVLWLVLKQPTTASAGQIRLFSQLFPHNARPVQPVNGRAVRDAQ